MSVLLDTAVLSLLFRRRAGAVREADEPIAGEARRLMTAGSGVLCGSVRQELLSGIANRRQFDLLRDRLRGWEQPVLSAADFERAAECHNRCRAAGVAGSVVDFLLCGLSLERGWPIFTVDRDFERYAAVLGLRLWRGPRPN